MHLSLVLLFFFFKQKTAYEMRISDWSSDVCSSDLYFRRMDSAHLVPRVVSMLQVEQQLQSKWKPRTISSSSNHKRPHHTAQNDQHIAMRSSEERRVGKECVSKCRYRWSPEH